MNVVVLIICFVISAAYHQLAYFIIPLLSGYHLFYKKPFRITLNKISRLYFYLILTIILFFILQSIFNLKLNIFSIKGVARYLTYFLFLIMIFSFNIKDIKYFFQLLIFYFVLTLPWGIYQVIELDRYRNILMHSNHLAYVLAICIYFLVYQKPFNKGVRVLCLIFLLSSLVLTKSSGGILVILTLLLYNIFKSRKISLEKKLMLVISFITTVALVINFSDKVALQLYTFIDFDWDFILRRANAENFGGYNSVVWRFAYWTTTLIYFFSENYLTVIFGVGIDSLTKGNMPYSFMYTDPHNDFIKVLVEFGLMGLFLFFILLKTSNL
jgi:O-antigen ligase